MIVSLVYILAIVSANLSAATFGPAVTPVNAFFLIGLDLTLRDHLHEKWKGRNLWPRMLTLIWVAGVISYLVNPASGMVAVASMVAFCLSGLVDTIVYHLLRDKSLMTRSTGSNAAGAITDSVIFPALAFGGFIPWVVAAQFAAKVGGGAVWALVLVRFRRPA